MLKYTIMRLIEALVVSIALTLVVFLLMHAVPGDPAAVIAGHTATPDEIAAVRAELGLDKPLPEQYVAYLSRLAHGEIGYSYSVQRDVTDQFTTAIWITLQLSLGGLLLSALIGIAFGILTGYYRNTIIDYIGISRRNLRLDADFLVWPSCDAGIRYPAANSAGRWIWTPQSADPTDCHFVTLQYSSFRPNGALVTYRSNDAGLCSDRARQRSEGKDRGLRTCPEEQFYSARYVDRSPIRCPPGGGCDYGDCFFCPWVGSNVG